MRYIWMFPRNKRSIKPLETALTLRAMVIASNMGESWGGHQEHQNQFSSLLVDYGLKEGGALRVENSGGSRTYESQLMSLGLLYKDSAGKLKLTQAGSDLVELRDAASTLEFQILKYQYPSAYSMGRNVDMSPEIKIRPFLFLLKLAEDVDLQGITDKDIVAAVVHAKSDVDYEKVKAKILYARDKGVASIIPDDYSIRTTKTKFNSFDSRVNDICDIANTFKNVLQGAGLIEIRYVGEVERFFPTKEVIKKIPLVSHLPLVNFVPTRLEEGVLQYGKREGAVKDTRRSFMPEKQIEMYTVPEIVLQKFIKNIALPASHSEIQDFCILMCKEFSINKNEVQKIIEPILSDIAGYAGAKIIELSMGGTKTAEAFERAVEKVYKHEFGFETEWTGRRRRAGTGGFMDIFVVETGKNRCGIIDTKATKGSYGLPHADVTKAIQTYIAHAGELYGSRGNLELSFVTYVSHLINPEAKIRAQEIYNRKNIPVSLISAYGLNSMRADKFLYQCPTNVVNFLTNQSVVYVD